MQQIGVKYRIYPTDEQKEYFAKCFGCCRLLYNRMLHDKIEYYNKTKKTLYPKKTDYDKEYPFLKEVDSLALANSIVNLNASFKNFFTQPDTGFPNYKTKHSHRYKYKTNNQDGTIKFIDDSHIIIPKLKTSIKIVKHRVIDGEIKSATIRQEPSGKYYMSILYEIEEIKPLKESKNRIGIDLGIKDFATFSNGTKIDNPKPKRKIQDKIARLERILSKTKFIVDKVTGKKSPSHNREKIRKKLAKLQEKASNQRNDFLHKLTKQIINENQVIVCEKLKIENMVKNHNLAYSIEDAGWGEFLRQIKYKSEWYGRTFIQIDTFYPSSKTCNQCGYINKELTLAEREWECPKCHSKLDRDINAAKNILAEGMKQISKK